LRRQSTIANAVSQVFDRSQKALRVFFKEPDCGIASVTKQTADEAAFVIMIDAQVLEEHRFMSRALRGSASLPMPLANRASTLLLMEETFQLLHRCPISAHQVGAPHCRASQRAFSVVFAPESLLTRHAA
jgi:hypothetical protein